MTSNRFVTIVGITFLLLSEQCSSHYGQSNSFEDFGETTIRSEGLSMTAQLSRPRYVGQTKKSEPTPTIRSGTLAQTQPNPTPDMTALVFPNTTVLEGPRLRDPLHVNFNPVKPPKIPLKFLRKLSHETSVINVFEKYVSNVEFKNVNGQKYLVSSDGTPIETGLGGPAPTEEPSGKAPVIKPFSGTFDYRNKINKPTAMANEERIASNLVGSKVTRPALCEPELKTVEVPKSSSPSIIQFPRCVRLERCGGCCGSELLTCEPLRSKATEVQIQKFQYNSQLEKLEYTGTETITLPSHEECRCNCRVKAKDCSANHEYVSEDCLCTCKDRGRQEACLGVPHKLWDPNLCECVCKEIKACPSGRAFDLETCDCRLEVTTPVPRNRRDKNNAQQKRHAKRGL